MNDEIKTVIEQFINNYDELLEKGEMDFDEAIERGQEINEICRVINENGLFFVQYLKDNEEIFRKFKFIITLYLKNANSDEAIKNKALEFSKEINEMRHPLSCVTKIVEKIGLLDPGVLFLKEIKAEDIRPEISDMLTDFLYYSRKSDENFTVDEARSFFSKKENREDFLKIVKEELDKKGFEN